MSLKLSIKTIFMCEYKKGHYLARNVKMNYIVVIVLLTRMYNKLTALCLEKISSTHQRPLQSYDQTHFFASFCVYLSQVLQVPKLTWKREENYMVKTWYLQRSQKLSCNWCGRRCRTSLLSSLRLLPLSPWASLFTTLLESRAEENVSATAFVTSVTFIQRWHSV